jgi:serine/threonine-protein kinase
MAPEQVAADPEIDHRADIYALGVMAYEMLAGVTPFAGRTRQALMTAHLAEAPRPLGELREGIPRPLCDLVMRCLEKDPARRPQRAEEIVAALDDPAVISGSFSTPPTLTPPPIAAPGALTPPALATRRARRVGLAAALALLLAALAIGGVVMRSRAVPAPPVAAAATPSIAVLPLVYIGTDSSRRYVADGIADAITGSLARLPGLRVASRTASASLQRRIALGQRVDSAVATLLEGVVQHEGKRLRVATRLVSARDGFTLWADAFEGDDGDLFALQDEIAEASADALRQYFALDALPPPR